MLVIIHLVALVLVVYALLEHIQAKGLEFVTNVPKDKPLMQVHLIVQKYNLLYFL